MLGTPSAAMMGRNMHLVEPIDGGSIMAVLAAVILYSLAALAISRGIRASAKIQLGVAGLLALTMIVVVAASLPHADSSNLEPFAPHSWLAIGSAASVLMFAFVGWEAVSPLLGEFRDPSHTIFRGQRSGRWL